MSDAIVMRHPTLPKEQEIRVPRDAMPHYTSAGWQRVPDEELEKRAALKAQAEAEAAAAEESPASEPAEEPEPEQSEPAESTNERPARSRTKTAAKKSEEES